jgi:hypothetical protein
LPFLEERGAPRCKRDGDGGALAEVGERPSGLFHTPPDRPCRRECAAPLPSDSVCRLAAAASLIRSFEILRGDYGRGRHHQCGGEGRRKSRLHADEYNRFPMKVLVDISVVPLGVGLSLSRYVAACEKVFTDAGLKTALHAWQRRRRVGRGV